MKLVVISTDLCRELVALACASTERETCGALIGSRNRDILTITRVEPLPNLSTTPDSFECDSAAIVALDQHLTQSPTQIVGFWHSHASKDTTPSTHDAHGAWPTHLTAIVSPTSTHPLRFWRFEVTTPIEVRAIPHTTLAPYGPPS